MLKQKLIRFRQAMTKKGRQGIAALLCASMLLPTVARGVPFYIAGRSYVTGSWDPQYIEEAKNKRPEDYQSYEATGLAYNMTWFQSKHDVTPSWPFMWEHHLTQNPGAASNPKYADFDNRHIYCVANHKPNYILLPGMQAFKAAEYNTQELPNFAVGSSAEQKKFNFLMTAIACGYPIEYDAESTASVPDYLICQAIAWVATSEGAEWVRGSSRSRRQSDSVFSG